jgi:hypothetical protein
MATHISSTAQYTDPNALYFSSGHREGHKTTKFSDELEHHLGKANNFALEVLGQPRQPVLGHSDERPSRCCSLLSPLIIDTSPSYGRRTYIDNSVNVYGGGYGGGNNNNETARAICMLGTMVLIAASAALGYCVGNYLNTQDEIKEKDRFKIDLDKHNIHPKANEGVPYRHLNLIRTIFDTYSELLAKRLDRDRINCFTAVALVASGAVLAVGGAVGSSAAMVVGGTALVATISLTAFRLMLELQRKDNTEQLARCITEQYGFLQEVRIS